MGTVFQNNSIGGIMNINLIIEKIKEDIRAFDNRNVQDNQKEYYLDKVSDYEKWAVSNGFYSNGSGYNNRELDNVLGELKGRINRKW
jgi:hypothetical protein